MKNIVLIPAWRRPDFLTVCTDLIKETPGADRNVYVFALDRNYAPESEMVARSFPFEKVIRVTPNHRFNGNSYNVLEGYKACAGLVPKYQSKLVYLIEDDIFIGKDFFDFHEKINEQHDAFCVSAVRNQNDERMLNGSLGHDPAEVYRFGKYQSLGVSWKPQYLNEVICHAHTGYYATMERYLVKTFPKSVYGTMWSEQDGLINRVMEARQTSAIYPTVPRAYHAGFIGYNRKGAQLPGRLEERVALLKRMTADEMNALAQEYKDITPIDLSVDHKVEKFSLVDDIKQPNRNTMVDASKYTQMQKRQYEAEAPLMNETGNHRHHDANQDYWDILYGDIKFNREAWSGKRAFDFGCGQGRNVVNLLRIADFAHVDGGDISQGNLDYAAKNIKAEYGTLDKSSLYCLNGVDLQPIPDNTYDFVTSVIVMQHIAVYDIRLAILKEKYRILKKGGVLSFQMGFDDHFHDEYTIGYYENATDVTRTNGYADVCVLDPKDPLDDLTKIGFKDVTYQIRDQFADRHHKWIYFRAVK
jgi:ubiquinone/menaquinone biosynthesis C-methylase UbiE